MLIMVNFVLNSINKENMVYKRKFPKCYYSEICLKCLKNTAELYHVFCLTKILHRKENER
jgi:hypothetical protein